MGLLDKLRLKNEKNRLIKPIEDKNSEINTDTQNRNIEDFLLTTVEFDDISATSKVSSMLKKQIRTENNDAQKPTALALSAKRLLKLQNELKGLTIMQVENSDGDIIPKGIITGKFEIERAVDTKRWRFFLSTNSNAKVATSRVYSSVDAVMNGIQSVIENVKKALIEDQTLKKPEILPFPKWVVYLDNKQKFNFILYTSNGNPAIHSHGYSNKLGCKKGIECVINACKNPMIEKTYLHDK